MKVLLLEDNERLSNLIIEALEEKKYNIVWFKDGKKAMESIFDGYDCYVLDINVPGIDGLTILKEIKTMNIDAPCIIISANIVLETIKDAYLKGCDEYLKKPFYIYELVTKLDKLSKKNESIVYLKDNYTFDMMNEILFKEGEEVKLTKKEILLFLLFCKNKNKIISFEQIEQYVWQGYLTNNENIRALIKRLRKKLPKDLIVSQGGMGYKIVVE